MSEQLDLNNDRLKNDFSSMLHINSYRIFSEILEWIDIYLSVREIHIHSFISFCKYVILKILSEYICCLLLYALTDDPHFFVVKYALE